MGDDAFFVYEDPTPRRVPDTLVDWPALELAAKRAKGRWIKLTDPHPPKFATTVRKHLAADYQIAQRAIPGAEGPDTHAIYVRWKAGEDDE